MSTFASLGSRIVGCFLSAVGWTLLTAATLDAAPPAGEKSAAAAPGGPASGPDTGPAEAPKERQSLGLSQISIIDKFMGAEYALGPLLKRRGEEEWAAEYRGLYKEFSRDANPGNLPPTRAILALALGMKASDGVLALKGRDREALNACAEQIEKLAAKLNVPAKNLQRAAIIKHHALASRWVEAFMELGFLQREVSRTLEADPTQKDEALLIIVGSWLQGGRCITSLIAKNHTTESSNILREPRLVKIMAGEMDQIAPVYKADPVVQEILKFLPEVQKDVNVGRNEPVPVETVKRMHERFSQLTDLILKPAATKP